MSYFRGELYAWNDGDDDLHLWSDTRDAAMDDGIPLHTQQKIKIPKDKFDQLAVMRLAELCRDGRLEAAIDHAVTGGNAGGLWLESIADQLKARLKSLRVPE